MIVFEQRLSELFDLLPLMKDSAGNDAKIYFNWGTQDVLNKYLALNRSEARYPLIWLVVGEDEYSNTNKNFVKRSNARLLIAINSTAQDYFNPDIYNVDYKNVLNPLLENIVKALNSGSISRMSTGYSVQRLPNYQVNDNNGELDVWNAIVFDADIELTNNCLNPNLFKNG